jgi:hypothetical protein
MLGFCRLGLGALRLEAPLMEALWKPLLGTPHRSFASGSSASSLIALAAAIPCPEAP